MAKPLVTKAHNVSDATIQKHIRQLTELKSEADSLKDQAKSANGHYRAGVKAAKDAGINTDQMIQAMKDKQREASDVIADMRDYIRLIALLNMPVTQMDLFGTEQNDNEAAQPSLHGAPTEHELWDAEQKGKTAGTTGHPKETNPHPPGLALNQAWHRGWIRGQEENARGSRDGVKKASTRRARAPTTSAVN
jgi:ribosome modulation factor